MIASEVGIMLKNQNMSLIWSCLFFFSNPENDRDMYQVIFDIEKNSSSDIHKLPNLVNNKSPCKNLYTSIKREQ